MEEEIMYIDQALHGYSDGHHLLASSFTQMSDKSLKIMSVLSDFSGPERVSGFDEYITGYPLVADQMYAIAKTWYAYEMKRPGCVWTHTLLIKNNVLSKVNILGILNEFLRPSENEPKFSRYMKPILVNLSLTDNSGKIIRDDESAKRLMYLAWAHFMTSSPIIIPVNNPNSLYMEELRFFEYFISLMKDYYTFSTGSIANRTIDKKQFDVQFVPAKFIRNFTRNNVEPFIFEINFIDDRKYPEWASIFNNPDQIKDFVDFASLFKEEIYYERQVIGSLLGLYFSCMNNHEIGTAFEFVQKTFNKEMSDRITGCLIRKIFNNGIKKWFAKNWDDLLIEVSTIKTDIFDEINFNNYLKVNVGNMWKGNDIYFKKIFLDLIKGNINKFGELLIANITSNITIENMLSFSELKLDACCVLISANSRLALLPDLWKQGRDFQLNILDCIENKDVDLEALLNIVFNKSDELLYKQIYNIFGNQSVRIVLDLYYHSLGSTDKIKKAWLSIINFNPSECIEWVKTKDFLSKEKMLVDIIRILDPYSNQILAYESGVWERIFNQIRNVTLDTQDEVKISLFLLPIILKKYDRFSDSMINFVFGTLNFQLAYQRLSFEDWEKIEKLLPELSWYHSWDKCKRLRKALKNKGYNIKSIYEDE